VGIAETGLFAAAGFSYHEADVDYSADAYLDLLRTYSSTLVMDRAAREGLLRCLADLIDSRFGGQITKRYILGLRVARRWPES
jgi:hypothetical protein